MFSLKICLVGSTVVVGKVKLIQLFQSPTDSVLQATGSAGHKCFNVCRSPIVSQTMQLQTVTIIWKPSFSEDCKKILLVSASFWSNLKLFRMMVFTVWLWRWNLEWMKFCHCYSHSNATKMYCTGQLHVGGSASTAVFHWNFQCRSASCLLLKGLIGLCAFLKHYLGCCWYATSLTFCTEVFS